MINFIGFDSEGIFKEDDTLLDPGVFESNLQTNLLGGDSQKLWSYDQKKTLQRFYLKKESEDKVILIQEDLSIFYNKFTQSLMNIFGKVSLKRFTELI